MSASISTLSGNSKLVGACKNCRERKVKCDGSKPICVPCGRSKLPGCNVAECIMWTDTYVEDLEDRVRWLEKLVEAAYVVEAGAGGLVTKVRTGTELGSRQFGSEAGRKSDTVVEEIGLLSLRGAGSYTGSMAGVTIAALVASVLRLYHHEIAPSPWPDPPILITRVRAAHPPSPLASRYIQAYLSTIHPFYPFLDLSTLAISITAVYERVALSRPEQPTPFAPASLFLVYALGALSIDRSELPLLDPHSPEEYYLAAAAFLPAVFAEAELDAVRAAGMCCLWSTRGWAASGAVSADAWQLAGFGLRLGISLGLTRNSYKWDMPEGERENRRRVWWSMYAIERRVATGTGRVLGIRNQGELKQHQADAAIDVPYPNILYDYIPDSLQRFFGGESPAIDIRPLLYLVRQRALLGDILECVYVTRSEGSPSMSPEETTNRVVELQGRLIAWQADVSEYAQPGTAQQDVFRLLFNHAVLVLHRPSPSFPTPAADAMQICLSASRNTIRIAHFALQAGTLGRICPGWEGYVGVFLSGLTLLYCSWAGTTCADAATTTQGDTDIQLCLSFLQDVARRYRLSDQYASLFRQIMLAFDKILTASPLDDLFPARIGGALQGVARDAGLSLPMDEYMQLDADSVDLVNMLFDPAGAWSA